MNTTTNMLRDDAARATAMSALGRSLMVEAGAGSGKTAVMAGRVAMLLAAGAAPKSIAAVTFTELAAGELLHRVHAFVTALITGQMPAELAVALPNGLDAQQRHNLHLAAAQIDEVTCSTIHGFCQRLILPYPVEASIDPGAAVMDRDHADMVFNQLGDQWLWAALDGSGSGLLAHLAAEDSAKSIALVREILGQMREHRMLVAPLARPVAPLIEAFALQAATLENFLATCGVDEADTRQRARLYSDMAHDVERRAALSGHARVASLLFCRAHTGVCTAKGEFKAFNARGKWKEAAKAAGRKGEGDALFDQAAALVSECQDAWTALAQEIVSSALEQLVVELRPMQEQFQTYKRNAALLDFDDLIHSALTMLRDHDDVRRALARRYQHVLVDEFQDTDPLQSEIFWRLCGDAAPGQLDDDWRNFVIRDGALFLVGDPKQAIYRFRGADIAAYTAARSRFEELGNLLAITTNFRSCAPILDYVNNQFEAPLNATGQPGFTPLDAFHAAQDGQVCVAALDVAAADRDGEASSEQRRDAEAEAVATMCASLIGTLVVRGRTGQDSQLCRAGHIALLAPTGKDLWRYEEALERRGIAVATQAGKGFFRRQEIQDMIALSRVLADSRDTIALGALLRGPLVGLTEEELLDIICGLPPVEGRPLSAGRLSTRSDVTHVQNELACETLTILQGLRSQARSTTPHLILSRAVDLLRVRPKLLQRHSGRAERALANIDKFLTLSQSYSVQGLVAFAAAMTLAWSDESRAPEGQPDAQEDAVTLYTMHSAKGLEWPVVVPINAMTKTMPADSVFCERTGNHLCCPIFGAKPAGYEAHRDNEVAELNRERMRLWYVAATRARELLVLPRLDVSSSSNVWISLLDLGLDSLPALNTDVQLPTSVSESGQGNHQTRVDFDREAATISASVRPLQWRTPSRGEGEDAGALTDAMVETGLSASDFLRPVALAAPVQGGRDRGLIMHKLFEEVLTGELGDDQAALCKRATELIAQFGFAPGAEANTLSAAEIAECVDLTLHLPEIAKLRPSLVAEFSVFGAEPVSAGEVITTGIADAICISDSGQAQVVIDWKSDVSPSESVLKQYRAQVSDYLKLTNAGMGMIVFASSRQIIEVKRDSFV